MKFETKLNLQLFDTQTTLLNAAGNDLSPEMKTFYDMALIDMAEPNLVHDQFGQKRPIPKNGGKSIEFRKFSALPKALKAITEGVTPAGNKLNVTAITAQVAQYGDFVQQSDVLELTAIDNTVVEATKLLGAQAGRTLDTITRNEIVGGTNVLYASGATREGLGESNLISLDLIFKAAAILKAANAPQIDGSYVAIIHPHVAKDLMVAAKDAGSWVDINKYANPEAIFNGEIGKIGGVRFVETTEAKIWQGADLAQDGRTLTVNGAISSGSKSVTFDGGTVAANALAGRYVLIGGTRAKVTANTTSTLTLDTNVTAEDNAVIYPGEGGAGGIGVYATMVLGANAYGVTEVTGGGLQHIVKQLGYGDDPLNQRSSVGWKAIKTAKRLVEEYMVRIETCSSFSKDVEAN